MSQEIDDPPVEESHSVYDEKKWGKENGKNYIVDGYVFRGKQEFNKALEGLKDIMKKGITNEIGSVKFKALDARIKGTGLEIDVEVVDNKNRGFGLLKLFGPSSKDEYVVMVSKSKKSDRKFFIILAEKVVKPLMNRFLSEEQDNEGLMKCDMPCEKTLTVEEKIEIFKCNLCEKTFASAAGLKGHVTKMHTKKTNKRKALAEVKNVVEDILKEVIEISDDEDKDEVTLEETVSSIDPINEKKYENKCDLCGHEVVARRRYVTVQMILKHKETCVIKSCTECDFISA